MTEKEDIQTIEKQVRLRFWRSLVDALNDSRSGIHVSNLVHACLRRGYYQIKDGAAEDGDAVGVEKDHLTLWIGKKLHSDPMSEMHEYSMTDRRVTGTLDEAFVSDGGSVVIVDKKTTTHIPTSSYNRVSPLEHHKKQVEFYATMLEQEEKFRGKQFFGAILYIDINEKKTSIGAWRIEDIEKARADFVHRTQIMETALSDGQPPSSYHHWLCNYCSYYAKCVKEDTKSVDIGRGSD